MEIKCPFSWTSCSCGPSEVEGDRRGPGVGGPQDCSADLSLPLSLEIRPWLSPHHPEPCTGRGPAWGPVAGDESPERAQGCSGPKAIPAGSE